MTRRVKTPRPGGDAGRAAGGDPGATSARDGRSTRWSTHREERRQELVLAAVAAIDTHGPQASIGDIAAAAGVSKPVLYRYFADKADLHAAVGTWGAGVVMDRLAPVVFAEGTVRQRVERGCEAYLRAIEEHPNVFLLLVTHRVESDADPLADGKAAIAAALARLIGDGLRELGLDAAGAEPWAHGIVGLGLSTGEWWLTRRTMSRTAVSGYLAGFVWHALEGVAGEHGVVLDDDTSPLRLVDDGRNDR